VRDRLLQPVSRSQRVLSTQLISLQLMVLRLFRTTSSPKFRRFTVCRVLISTISTLKVIVRQMMRKVKIDDSGSSYLLPGSLIDRGEVARLNEEIQAQIDAGDENARLITTVPVLQGITKASSYSDSFLSAASFQETTKALTDAALRGKTISSWVLRKIVIIGKLIPAGTGMDVYNNVQVVKNESAANHNTAETPLF